MTSEATIAYGARVTSALLGVDALYRGESGDQTGLVVLDMDVERRYSPATYADYAQAAAALRDLEQGAVDLPEADRRVYYAQVCRSTLAFIAWRSSGLGFRSQLADFLHVDVAPASEAQLDGLRRDMHATLNRLGYGGDLSAQATAWEEHHRVPPDSVRDTLTELLAESWSRTEAWLGGMPAPRSDGMGVKTVAGVPYNARCDYLSRTIEINVDPVLTRPALKHLAVHEGYPGHWLQFKLRETMAREGRAAPDVLLSVVNTASSCVFEGIADYGMRMIGWELDDDDRLQGLMTRYRAGIGTGAGWRLHGLGWAEGAATDWLRAQSLIGGEGWVGNRMRFVAAPERAVLIWSYWHGEPAVAAAFDGIRDEERPVFVEFLYGRMHSTQSVGMFAGSERPRRESQVGATGRDRRVVGGGGAARA